ncbi:MAG: ribosomal protein bacterial type [Gammaproteobacteria bacterium]|jgi:small subunit ribosomal protein S3|nr:ribosomal protein bacterial type [Gammaproteobacteria bacterium]
MGQKVNPVGLRIGARKVKDWSSKWYAQGRKFADTLLADFEARKFLQKELHAAGIAKVAIERLNKTAKIVIYAAKPGVIIGKKGEDIERIRAKLTKLLGVQVHINIEEVKKPELNAKLIGDSIAQQLERRVMFRRAMKKAVTGALKAGAKGIKISVSGRLGGAEIARTEWYREGRVPLHTLRADIDYAHSEALTTYGIIGVKVWVYKGDVFEQE